MEVKQSRTAAETIHRRERDSGWDGADQIIKTGDGARRTIHHVHLSGSAKSHGPDNPGEPGIDGRMRGPANRTGEIK